MSHKVGASRGPENLKVDGFTHRNGNEILLKRELQENNFFCDNGVDLTEILQGLRSLDKNGYFSSPRDNSFAADKSKITGKNICFSVMCDRIQSKEYKTWRSFVEDFEDICHNAMNRHEEGSTVWEAANSLLYHGRRYLAQYADRALAFFGLRTTLDHRSTCLFEAPIENTVCQEGECSFPQSKKDLVGAVSNGKCHNLASKKSGNALGSSDMIVPTLDERLQNAPHPTLLCKQNMVHLQEQEFCKSNTESTFDVFENNAFADDSIVEILESTGEEIRFNPSEQATECSSSFGDTELDNDDNDSGCKMYDAVEVESDLQDGNGAAIAAEDNMGGFKKRKKALSDEWKGYRRHVEWRCQWLELRVKELLSQASKYDHILVDIQARKLCKAEQRPMEDSTTRSFYQMDHTYRHRILQRKKRKKIESMVDFSAYMCQHPLFSLYEKKRLDAEDVSVDDDSNSIISTVEVNDAGLDENDLEGPLIDGDNSVEQMLVHIETLQSRIVKMKNQLSKFHLRNLGKFGPRNISSNFITEDSSKNVCQSTAPSTLDSTMIETPAGGDSKLQEGFNLSHHQDSVFDILNPTMNGMPSSVESAQYDAVETSNWRLLDNDALLDHPDKEESSDEVTDEEIYKEYHSVMEVREKKQRAVSRHGTKRFEGESILGKGTSKQQTTGSTEKEVDQSRGENTANICLPFNIFVPKCKRRKTHSRSSSLQKFEALHAPNIEEPNPSLMQDHETNEVKTENKADPMGDRALDNL